MQKDELNNLATIADLNRVSEKIIGELHRMLEKDKPKFYTPSQFCKITGMPYTTVIHYCKKRLLQARQDNKGSAWLIKASEVERFSNETLNNHLAE